MLCSRVLLPGRSNTYVTNEIFHFIRKTCGWVEDNYVNLIDDIERKYKDRNSYFKLTLNNEKHEVF